MALGIKKFRKRRSFKKAARKLHPTIQDKLEILLKELVEQEELNPTSRDLKKWKQDKGIWKAKVDDHYQMSFGVEEDTAVLRNVDTHDQLQKRP